MLLDKLVNRHETAANPDDKIAVLDLHDYFLGEVAVVTSLLTLIFTHEEALHALVRVTFINKIG